MTEYRNPSVIRLLKAGYPFKIKMDGYEAYLYDIQPLLDGDFEAIYFFPGGQRCVDLYTVQHWAEIIQRFPEGYNEAKHAHGYA